MSQRGVCGVRFTGPVDVEQRQGFKCRRMMPVMVCCASVCVIVTARKWISIHIGVYFMSIDTSLIT